MTAAGRVKFGAYFWQQRTDWPSLASAVIAADANGFDSVWIWDHLLAGPTGPAEPIFEGWTSIAALASRTTAVTVGLLVGAIAFRNPGLLAKMVTTVDHISGGRGVLGLGAGWYELEHRAHGLDFGDSVGARLGRIAEAAPLIRRLLDGETVSHRGPYYTLDAARQSPRPVRPHLPLLIGGSGKKKTTWLVARHADMWHAQDRTMDALMASEAALQAHCASIGRDPGEIERLINKWVAIRDEPAEAHAILDRGAIEHGYELADDPSRQPGARAVGLPEDVAAALRPYVEAGFRHILFTFRSPFDLETIDRMAEVRNLLA
jgi:alkanesulfonate monooxygenase SsuD/methylene tetrahydromethanopterin reductase-like flavin-dependent oxidoreductase (luciferase family)